MSAALLGPLGLCADALEVHASMPPGRVIAMPASRVDDDELQSTPGAASAIRSHYRMAEHAKALGMSQAQFRAARRAGTLPAEFVRRHPRSDKGVSRAAVRGLACREYPYAANGLAHPHSWGD